MSVAGKIAGAAVSTTRFTTNVSRSAARAASSAGVTSTPKGEQTAYRGKSAAITGGRSTTSFTTMTAPSMQQRFMSGFAAGPGTERVPSF
ncbi:hypothetical protein IWW55_005272, partial [Coemansia sp. RSA 2706]